MSSTVRISTRASQLRASLGAVDRARLMVVPRLRSRAPRVPFVSLLSLLLLGGVVGLLLFNTSMQQASFTASQLDNEASILAAKRDALTTELDALRNPKTLAFDACALGMVRSPAAVGFVDVGTKKISGATTPAEAAKCPTGPPVPPKPGAATARAVRGDR